MFFGLKLLQRLLFIAIVISSHGFLEDLWKNAASALFADSLCHGLNERFRGVSLGSPLEGLEYSARGSGRPGNRWFRRWFGRPRNDKSSYTLSSFQSSFRRHARPLIRSFGKARHDGKGRSAYAAFLTPPSLGGMMARGHGTNGFRRTKRRYRINLMENEKKHELLKKLYLEREHYLKNSSRKKSNMYRYFNITYENIEHHLNRTMDEFFEDLEKDKHNTLYIVDGNAFSGRYADLRIPVPREWASFEFEGQNPHGLEPVSKTPSDVKPNFGNELLESIYSLLNSPESGDEKHVSPKNSTSKEAIELYDEVGDYDYQEFERFKTYRKDYLQNIEFKSNDESKKQRELLHNLMIQPTAFPSYLDPDNPILRTGRRRELQRKRDSGRLQRKRWHMDVPSEDDIARGRRRVGDNVTKEFLDSIEWEQPLPTYHDSNFFKRSFYESGFGGDDRTLDSYFDVQFIGATDAYPFAVSAGMQFAWPIYW